MNDIIYAGKHLLTLSVTRHAHATWELIYCTEGRGEIQFSDMVLPYETGDIVAVPPFLPHANVSEMGFTNIHINMANAVFPFQSPTVIHDDGNQFVMQAFSAACFHFNSGSEQRRMLLSPLGDLICGYLTAYRQTQPLSKVVRDIENDIIQNYHDCSYELDKYLQEQPFSYDYLRKVFKKELGVTPHQYLSDKRLQTAAELLGGGFAEDNNIAEISQMCGFREPLYFSRMFKKKFGIAPSYYQEQQRKQNAEAPLDEESVKINLESLGV